MVGKKLTNVTPTGTAVRYAFAVVAFAVMWQAVRYAKGDVGSPIVSWFFPPVPKPWESSEVSVLIAYGAQKFIGFTTWVLLGGLVAAVGQYLARSLEIGWSNAFGEQMEIEREAARRREVLRTSQEPSSDRAPSVSTGFSLAFVIGAMLTGFLIGSIF